MQVETPNLGVSTFPEIPGFEKTPNLGVSTGKNGNYGGKKSQWKSGTLGVIINQYKRKCTIEIRKIHADFAWQSRYHDHIIRNQKTFERIQTYIQENPLVWMKDTYYEP